MDVNRDKIYTHCVQENFISPLFERELLYDSRFCFLSTFFSYPQAWLIGRWSGREHSRIFITNRQKRSSWGNFGKTRIINVRTRPWLHEKSLHKHRDTRGRQWARSVEAGKAKIELGRIDEISFSRLWGPLNLFQNKLIGSFEFILAELFFTFNCQVRVHRFLLICTGMKLNPNPSFQSVRVRDREIFLLANDLTATCWVACIANGAPGKRKLIRYNEEKVDWGICHELAPIARRPQTGDDRKSADVDSGVVLRINNAWTAMVSETIRFVKMTTTFVDILVNIVTIATHIISNQLRTGMHER